MNLKKLVESYLKLTLWYRINLGDQSKPLKKFEAAAKKIGELENQLRLSGATDKSLNVLNDHVERLATSKVEDLNQNEQLFLNKVIFGEKTEWKEEKLNETK